jgi:hypothetical protein
MSIADELAKMAELHQSGILTAEEFAIQKDRLLNPPDQPSPGQGPVKTPEIKTPEIKTPEIKTPEIKTPEIKTPEMLKEERTAQNLVTASHWLGWGGLFMMFILGPTVGIAADSSTLGGSVSGLGFVCALVGAIIGQVGRGMQGRAI